MDEHERRAWNLFGALLAVTGAASLVFSSGPWLPADAIATAVLVGAGIYWAFAHPAVTRFMPFKKEERGPGRVLWQRAALDDGVLAGLVLLVFSFFIAVSHTGGTTNVCLTTHNCIAWPTGSSAALTLIPIALLVSILSFILTLVRTTDTHPILRWSLALFRGRVLQSVAPLGLYVLAIVLAARFVTQQGGEIRLLAISVTVASSLCAIQCYRDIMFPPRPSY